MCTHVRVQKEKEEKKVLNAIRGLKERNGEAKGEAEVGEGWLQSVGKKERKKKKLRAT